MHKYFSGRPIEIHSHHFYAKGVLIEIGGLSEHGWFLVESDNGTVTKYDMFSYNFNFTDKESLTKS